VTLSCFKKNQFIRLN